VAASPGEGPVENGTIFVGKGPQRFDQQVVLAVEMQVDNALRQAGLARDVADTGIAQSLAGNAFHRGINELPAALLARRGTAGFAGCGGSHEPRDYGII
jgi:hypothetical protein